MVPQVDSLSSWQTCRSNMVLTAKCCLPGGVSSPLCIICPLQSCSFMSYFITRVCVYLLGFYGLFYAISIPYHHGHVTPQVFYHTCHDRGNESPHNIQYFIALSLSSGVFFSILFCFASLRWNIVRKSKKSVFLLDFDTCILSWTRTFIDNIIGLWAF